MSILEEYESNVKYYCRVFPEIFNKAKGSIIESVSGKKYIDFFSAAGSVNYGHNNEFIKQKILDYLNDDGIIQGLDMFTYAKQEFVEKFVKDVLIPKNLNYKIQFCGSTGTNAVEAALKLARKVKQRSNIFSFMGGFHGMSLGSLAVTGNISKRKGAGTSLDNVVFMPYPSGFMKDFDTIRYMEAVLNDPNSGIEKPAAIILETVQAEGGVIVAENEWLKKLADLCKIHDILLIIDDIQVGCGRTGDFFSFERAGIVPDIIILSKSISGYGMPMSMILFRPELDVWEPGEHNGTFRGNQLAFVGASAALDFRKNNDLEQKVRVKQNLIKDFLINEIIPLERTIEIRGIGMIWGIDFRKKGDGKISRKVIEECFKAGLIIEGAGRNDTVVKLMPALTIDVDILEHGFDIIKNAIKKNV